MHPRQGETGYAVIELPVRPGNRVVARLATRGEALVRGAGRVIEIFLMTRDASCACDVEAVIDVAIRAGARRNSVPPGQWKPNRIVIEFRIQPVVRPVALVASR
jgi:hypothetical protein